MRGISRGELTARILAAIDDRCQLPVFSVASAFRPPRDLTGDQLRRQAFGLARDWRSRTGDDAATLVLALPPGETFLVALVAAMLGGFTVAAVQPPRRGSQTNFLGHIVRDTAASAVICDEATIRGVAECLAAEGIANVPILEYAPAVADAAPALAGCATNDDVAIIQYTSGSTRTPKGVRISPANILANCSAVARAWQLDARSTFVSWLPHYHDMGLMGCIFDPLLNGAHSVHLSPLDMIRRPAFWLNMIGRYRARVSGAPAFAFAECLRRVADAEIEGLDLSCWSHAFCGGEPVPAGLLDAFRDRFAAHGLQRRAVFPCYGMAEYTLFAAGAPGAPPPAERPAGCDETDPCRIPDGAGDMLAIVDPMTRRPVEDGAAGEIWLRGPSVGGGYLGLADETRATFAAERVGTAGHWLRTGDLGVVAGPWLYVTGRIKDVLVVNGRKVAAPEIEWLASRQHAALNPHAAAAFQPSGAPPGSGVLMIEVKEGRGLPDDTDPAELRDRIARLVAGEWGIRLSEIAILPRGALQRTTSGKVRRSVIARGYRAQPVVGE